MFIELVEILRCPSPHDDTWLVASIDRLEGRQIVAGALGCPVCRATYPIADGILTMTRDAPRELRPHVEDASGGPVRAEAVVRAAALLGLGEGGGRFALIGETGRLAPGLEDVSDATLLLVAPPPGLQEAIGRSVVQALDTLPVAAGALRGVLVDSASATPRFLDSAVRALGMRGRLVAPVSTPLPPGVRELARDEREWVAEREAPSSSPVPLRRR